MGWYKIMFCFDPDGGDNMIIKKCKRSVFRAGLRLHSPSKLVKVSNIKYRKKRAVSYFCNWIGEPVDYIKVWVLASSKSKAIALLLRNFFQIATGENSMCKEYKKYAI